jgi:DNA-binding GntR family transcriptional regulator
VAVCTLYLMRSDGAGRYRIEMPPDQLLAASSGERRQLRPVSANDSAVDRVAAEIRRAILNGALAPGAPVSIASFSTQLKVSHIPVREALQRLEAQGLIALRAGRSAIVSPLDRNDLRSIYRLRLLIEPDLAARACPRLTASDLNLAEELLARYVACDNVGDDLWDIHRQFHRALISPVLTDWDLRVLEQLWHASERYTRVVFETYGLDPNERHRREIEHRVLLEAAKTGAPSELRSATRHHLAEHELMCLEWLASLSSPSPASATPVGERATIA